MAETKAVDSQDDFVEGPVVCPSHDDARSEHVRLWYSVRRWHKLVGYCVALSSAILLYGYDFVIIGTVSAMPAFKHNFGRELNHSYIIPTAWLSLWSAVGPIGMMAGSITVGHLQDRRGRRASLALGSMLSAVAIALCYVSDLPESIDSRRGVFLTGKLFQGFATGMMLCVTQTYMSEVLPTILRGPIIACFPIFTLLGQLLGAVVVHVCLKSKSAESYRICFASQWVLSALPLVVAAFLPESPAWLKRRNKNDKALNSEQRLGIAEFDTRVIVEDLRAFSVFREQTRNSNSPSYVDCFKGTHRRRTFIIAFASILPQLFGLTLLANASYFLEIVGMDANNSTVFLILGIALGLISNTVSLWTLNSVGRRILTLTTLGIAAILWLSMGIAGCFSGVVITWYTAVSMMAIIVVCGVGVWPASHVIAAETSSLHLRAKAQGIGWFSFALTSVIFSLVLPYIYNADQGNLSAKTGFVMAGFTVMGFIGAYITIPETKGRTPMQIDRMFDLELPAGEFKYWQSGIASDPHMNERMTALHH
ncbi:hypothetical protein N7474_001178 [Penicillium riverlandense]|uniref:uncharacterized protein n=1 Tax=Penicillium riverlandense TaxID=1903569 RepID=UPI0025480602|nr:uncharacterized protein N7474_001178 [Penicillium riverlandense]KAJ5832867.1 hypothetical protein N7474_001178 [Penicillium riverlandense]